MESSTYWQCVAQSWSHIHDFNGCHYSKLISISRDRYSNSNQNSMILDIIILSLILLMCMFVYVDMGVFWRVHKCVVRAYGGQRTTFGCLFLGGIYLERFFFSETRCLIVLELVKYTSLAPQGLAYLFIPSSNGIIIAHYNIQLFKMCILMVKLTSSGVQGKPLTKLSPFPWYYF